VAGKMEKDRRWGFDSQNVDTFTGQALYLRCDLFDHGVAALAVFLNFIELFQTVEYFSWPTM